MSNQDNDTVVDRLEGDKTILRAAFSKLSEQVGKDWRVTIIGRSAEHRDVDFAITNDLNPETKKLVDGFKKKREDRE